MCLCLHSTGASPFISRSRAYSKLQIALAQIQLKARGAGEVTAGISASFNERGCSVSQDEVFQIVPSPGPQVQMEKPLGDCTIAEVGVLLVELGLGKHADKFAEEVIDGACLVLAVEQEDLADLDMDEADQQTLLAAVARRVQSGVVAETGLQGACSDNEVEEVAPPGAAAQAAQAQMEKPLGDCTIAEVGVLLEELGLGKHADKFAEEVMDGSSLLDVEQDNLAELGMDEGDQQTLLAAIEARRVQVQCAAVQSGSRAHVSSGGVASVVSCRAQPNHESTANGLHANASADLIVIDNSETTHHSEGLSSLSHSWKTGQSNKRKRTQGSISKTSCKSRQKKKKSKEVETNWVTSDFQYEGRKVGKVFADGKEWFGVVTQYEMKKRWWKVQYDDGDKEDMNFKELTNALIDEDS